MPYKKAKTKIVIERNELVSIKYWKRVGCWIAVPFLKIGPWSQGPARVQFSPLSASALN